MPTLAHLHTYQRSRTNKRIYRCIHPDCTHFTSRESLEGKRALCAACGSEFLLEWDQLKNATPRCLNCAKSKRAQRHRATKSVLDDVFTDLFNEAERIPGE